MQQFHAICRRHIAGLARSLPPTLTSVTLALPQAHCGAGMERDLALLQDPAHWRGELARSVKQGGAATAATAAAATLLVLDRASFLACACK